VEEFVKPRGENDYKKYAAIVAAVVAAIGLAGVLAGVLHAAPSSFLHIRQKLSYTDYTSAYPELAVSPDRNYLAVTWVEGYEEKSGSKGHVYLRIASESGGWGAPIEVYHGDADACAYDRAAVAITGTTAHIAYVVFADCTNGQNTRVYYTTCSLTDGTCGSKELVLSTTTEKILWVDIAVDESGNPHLVFARYKKEGPYEDFHGKVFYEGHTGSGWGTEETVYDDADTNNHTPAIAWSDGCAHIAWEEEMGGKILYRRRCAGVWYPNPTVDPYLIHYSTPTYPPHSPDVATAPGGRLFVVWDCLAQEATAHTPATRYLLYKRSNDGGDTFYPVAYPLEVGTDHTGGIPDPYTEHVVGAAEDSGYYLRYLQPSVALNEDGWPAVVWHTGGVTGTYYTYATSGTDTSVDWMTPTLLFGGQAGTPVVGLGGWVTSTVPLLHVAYMYAPGDSWNVYYDSNEADVIDIPTVYLPLVTKGY
jgi:hypothetical protein